MSGSNVDGDTCAHSVLQGWHNLCLLKYKSGFIKDIEMDRDR